MELTWDREVVTDLVRGLTPPGPRRDLGKYHLEDQLRCVEKKGDIY